MGDPQQRQGHPSGSAVSNAFFYKYNATDQQVYNTYPSTPSPANKSIWSNMREPILSYTGRADKLDEVHNIFFPANKEIKPIDQIAIVGLGGVGKSEFARKFAQKYYTQLDENVAWINAQSAQLLIDSFKKLTTHIGVKFPELSGKAEILRMVDQVYGYFGEKKSLFIFDNVEDWVDGENAVKNYLPNRMAPSVKTPFVLMTSRVRPSGIKVIELPVLEVAEAVELIKMRLEVNEVECVELLVQLANLLGCLPLALQQASSYVKREMKFDISGKQNEILASCVETYVKMFEVETEKLLDFRPSEMDVRIEELKTTRLTWRLTLEKIQELNPSAMQLLEMMSYISPDDIHLEMFEEQFTVDALKAAVDTLVGFSMITKNSDNSNIVKVHRLVQTVVRLDNEEKQESALQIEKWRRKNMSMITKISNIVRLHRLVQRVLRTDYKEKQEGPQEDENDEGTPLESMLYLIDMILDDLPDKITPYTTSCVVHAQMTWEFALASPKLLKRFEDYPINLYNNTELREMHQTNLSLFERTLAKYKLYSIYGESNEQYIEVQHLIASTLLDLDKYEDAKLLCQINHKIAADELGDSNPLTLDILNSLALIEGRLGNYSEEMTILEKVIPIRTATPNVHKSTLVSLHNKAACLEKMGKYDEALNLFKSTLELMGEHHPEDRKLINIMRHLIAITTQRQGNFAEALQMFKKSHAELVESLGESHARTLECARGIGDCLLDLGECEEAMGGLTRAMELTNANKGNRLLFANMKYSIATVLLKMERHGEAISQFKIVLGERLSIYGETHPEVLITREQLADALLNTGCTGEALEHYNLVYEKRVKTIGADHPDTISVKYSIARVFLKMERYDEAISQFRIVLDEESRIFGETHPDVLTARGQLAHALKKVGRTGEALENYKFVYENRVKTLGTEHPKTIRVKYSIATVLFEMERYDEAIRQFRIVLDEESRIYGETHLDVLTTRRELARALINAGCFVEGLEHYKFVYENRVKTLGAEHPKTIKVKYSIATVLFEMERYDEAIRQFRIVLGEESSIYGETHTEVLLTREWLADALRESGGTEEALVHYKFVYENRVKTIGAKHPDVISVKYSIATALLKMERYDEAISQFRIVLDEESSIYGHTHTDVLLTREWLADALQEAGCTVEALEHYDFVFENRMKTMGADHPNTTRIKQKMESMRKRKRENKKEGNKKWKKIRLN